ncbi:hypothetical protein NP048_05370 [Cellulomonas xiejunii]|uniref:Asparagine synthetase domain-containing protein n=1 Tax=Cellulomonas xiejunii TaxID=2968083 RepID=A0ABY5KUE3_9CELL|nr:hypothetical protein [Cellulomonas xiejunii]UUI72877.1 hypothetical protein NP048_05370 [Cellulomonas xiejunii]
MLEVGEPVLGGEGGDELLGLGGGDLDGASAGAAHEVVVVVLAAGLAAHIGVLAGGLELDLEVALLGHRIERTHGRRNARTHVSWVRAFSMP